MEKTFTFRIANTAGEFESAKRLFEEYALSIKVDLSFQQFALELDDIQTQYGRPEAGIVLALYDGAFIGCCGVRRLSPEIAELKRMYVKDEFRSLQIGASLLQRSLELAKELGYKKIRLDTLEKMARAQRLYLSFGFYEIAPYRFNPLAGTVYMERAL